MEEAHDTVGDALAGLPVPIWIMYAGHSLVFRFVFEQAAGLGVNGSFVGSNQLYRAGDHGLGLVLGFLVAINAVANGANLAIAHLDAARRRAEAGNLATLALPLPLAVQAPSILPAVVPVAAEGAEAPVTKKPARKRTRAKGIKTARGSVRATVSTSQLN